MAKSTISLLYGTSGGTAKYYVSDFGSDFSKKVTIVLPAHLDASETLASDIATKCGAHLLRYAPEKDSATVVKKAASLCAVAGGFKPRKLKLIFDNGSSMTFPLAKPLTKDTYTGLVSAGETQGIKVICANLIGERFDNVNDVAQVSWDGKTAQTTAGRGGYYSGIHTYTSDIESQSQQLNFKIETTIAGTDLPTVFKGQEDCLNALAAAEGPSCPGGEMTVQRRVIANYNVATGDKFRPEQRALPIASNKAADILGCINGVSKTGLFCLAYRGEFRRRIDLRYKD